MYIPQIIELYSRFSFLLVLSVSFQNKLNE